MVTKGSNVDGETERVVLFDLNTGMDTFAFELDEILQEVDFDTQGYPYLNHIYLVSCSTKLLTVFHYEEDTKKISQGIFSPLFSN